MSLGADCLHQGAAALAAVQAGGHRAACCVLGSGLIRGRRCRRASPSQTRGEVRRLQGDACGVSSVARSRAQPPHALGESAARGTKPRARCTRGGRPASSAGTVSFICGALKRAPMGPRCSISGAIKKPMAMDALLAAFEGMNAAGLSMRLMPPSPEAAAGGSAALRHSASRCHRACQHGH